MSTPSSDPPQGDAHPEQGPPQVATVSKLVVMQPYLANLKAVVRKLLAEEPAGTPMCYSLVDGNNVIYEQDDGNLALRPELITEADKCLPPDTRSQVIVVWPQWKWNKLGTSGLTPQTFARLFDPLRQGTSVYFALVDYSKPRTVAGKTWLPNGVKKAQSWCLLPGMTQADHLACELDDAILTALHCEITRNNRCAIAVSGDRRVIKTRENLNELQTWVDAAYRTPESNFYVTTTFQKVTVSGPPQGVATALLGIPRAPNQVGEQ